MNDKQREVLLSAISTIHGVEGVSDSDDACLRCAARMIAEVLGLPFGEYRLLKEPNPPGPLYYSDYKQVSEGASK